MVLNTTQGQFHHSFDRIGVLGGTFDPPHYGHLILAETTREALKLDRVLFVPAANPPHKDHIELKVSPVEYRLAMVSAAIADNPYFSLSRADIDRPGPHYTVEMLAILQHSYPDAQLHFLLGGDSLRDLVTWRDPGGIIAQARLAVMRRPGAYFDLDGMEAKLPGIAARIDFVDAPVIGIAATTIRERVRAGQSVRYLVPPPVEEYIHRQRLYVSAVGALMTVVSPIS